MTASRPVSVLLALVLAACSSAGERAVVAVPPPRPPTDREDVERLVGELLSADARTSREAEEVLDRLDAPGRAALAHHSREIPTERDPRWLAVLDRHGLLGDAPPDVRLDLLVWKAGRKDARSAREGREGLAAWAKADPALLVTRLGAPGPGRAVLATALGEAGRRDAVPALLVLYRGAATPEERKAASGALGAIGGESLRPRVDGTPEEIEADAARVEAWYATGADPVIGLAPLAPAPAPRDPAPPAPAPIAADPPAPAPAPPAEPAVPAPPAAAGDVAPCEALLAEGRLAEAEACFRALAEAPGGERPEVQSGLGRALLRAGRPRAALEALRRAAAARGTPADHAVLADALVGSAEERMLAGPSRTIDVVPFLRDAIVAAEEAAKDPAQGRAATLAKARAHFLLHELDAARAALDLPELAADPVALDLRGRVEYAAERWAEAAKAFDAAGNRRAAATAWYAAKDPRVVDAYVALLSATPGDVALLEEAVGAARAASSTRALEAALAKGDPPAAAKGAWLHARARLLEADARPAEALAVYREAATAMPEDVRPLVHVARLRWMLAPEDPAALAEAEDVLRAALRLSPKDPDVRLLLGAVAARFGATPGRAWPDRSGLDRAIAIYRTLGEADPDDAEAWANAGNGHRMAGDAEASIEAYDRAIEANPHDALIWNDRGLAELAAGKEDAALASFARAAAVGPSELSPRQNAGRILWLRGDLDAAAAQYRTALRVARATGGSPMLYRFLLDRVERSRQRPGGR